MHKPRHIKTPEEFDERVDEFRKHCEAVGEPTTIAGLAYFLGFASRQSLYDYEKRYPDYQQAVSRARLYIESRYEMRLWGSNAGGAIFALKNMGWTDKQELEHGGGQDIRILRELVDSSPPDDDSDDE